MADITLATANTEGLNLLPAEDATVTVHVTEADYALLERVFGSVELNQVAASIAQSAFEEWIGWLSGRRRYTSMTDQAIDRVIDIYARVTPDVEPEIGCLYNKYNIPFGSARYIVQAITSRQLYKLNVRALDRLIATLEEQAGYLSKLSDAERKVLQEIQIVIDPRAEKMLTTIIELMPINQRPVSTLRRTPTSLPNTRQYSMSPRDLMPILEAMKKFRN